MSSPQGAHVEVDESRAAEPLRQQLPRPRRPSRDRRGGARGARPLGLRDGLRALHLRHPGSAPQLEKRLSEFLGTEDTILFSSCFDANGGLFEALLDERDAVISDQLNHASIIDGIRLCKARRLRYANGDMDELEQRLARPPMPAIG